MDDQSALIEDYEITIDSMKREILLLYEKLSESPKKSEVSEEYEKLQNSLEIYKQDIEGSIADIIEEKRKNIFLKAEED